MTWSAVGMILLLPFNLQGKFVQMNRAGFLGGWVSDFTYVSTWQGFV